MSHLVLPKVRSTCLGPARRITWAARTPSGGLWWGQSDGNRRLRFGGDLPPDPTCTRYDSRWREHHSRWVSRDAQRRRRVRRVPERARYLGRVCGGGVGGAAMGPREGGREGPLDVQGDVVEQALRLRTKASQLSGDQTSNRLRTPTRPRPGRAPRPRASAGGSRMRPCTSISQSAARLARRRVRALTGLLNAGSAASCVSSLAHSEGE